MDELEAWIGMCDWDIIGITETLPDKWLLNAPRCKKEVEEREEADL